MKKLLFVLSLITLTIIMSFSSIDASKSMKNFTECNELNSDNTVALTAIGTVTGIVRDAANNSPMPGVVVMESGTLNGVITDTNGKYSIKVATVFTSLVFMFTGYVTQSVYIEYAPSTHDVSMVLDE